MCRIVRNFVFLEDIMPGLAMKERMGNFFRPLETEIRPTKHQQRRNQPRREIRQQKRRGQQDDELVLDRPLGDLPDDRQFPLGFEPMHIFRRHRRVVDHSPRRLGTGLGCPRRHVVNRRRRDLGNSCHIIQQGQQTAHRIFSCFAFLAPYPIQRARQAGGTGEKPLPFPVHASLTRAQA